MTEIETAFGSRVEELVIGKRFRGRELIVARDGSTMTTLERMYDARDILSYYEIVNRSGKRFQIFFKKQLECPPEDEAYNILPGN